LDEIVAMPEVSFFLSQHKDLNIFQLLYDKSLFFGKGDILEQHYFSFYSLIEKFGKLKFFTTRDLTRYARRLAASKYDMEDTPEVSDFTAQDISLDDLLGVATGRFTPEFVYKNLNADKNVDGDWEIGKKTVAYRSKHRNRAVLVEHPQQESK
jgi:hypothetical protein